MNNSNHIIHSDTDLLIELTFNALKHYKQPIPESAYIVMLFFFPLDTISYEKITAHFEYLYNALKALTKALPERWM